METLLKRIILENQDLIFSKKILTRSYSIPETENISVLTGIRRCGKTFMLYQIAQGLKKEQVLFIDFEDERLVALNTMDNYDLILDAYHSIYPNKKPLVFFDEIQNLKNWHLYLKRLQVSGYKVFVTGSNANLLSREIATFLKGRSIETHIYPFSFSEFLQLKNKTFTHVEYITKVPEIQNLYEEYLKYGALPEVIKAKENDKRAVAKNIFNLLFYRDVVVRYDKNEYLLKLIIGKIVENITKEFSVASLAKKVSAIQKASIPTITDYFNILPEPFLTHNLYQFRTSFIQREGKRKTYFTDNSFIFLNSIETDWSRLFENQVFAFLNRKYEVLHYYKCKNGKEVDFYVGEGRLKPLLIQASVFINDDSKERELKSLLVAMKELDVNKGYILTLQHEETIQMGEKTIDFIPLWKLELTDRKF